jgi:hypothetical protein
MNENLKRLQSGWCPRKDAHFIYWILSDIIMLISMIKSLIKKY